MLPERILGTDTAFPWLTRRMWRGRCVMASAMPGADACAPRSNAAPLCHDKRDTLCRCLCSEIERSVVMPSQARRFVPMPALEIEHSVAVPIQRSAGAMRERWRCANKTPLVGTTPTLCGSIGGVLE